MSSKLSTEAALRAGKDRQAFLLRLNDALRSLADPVAIQYQAARVLGEYLGANRVGYAEDQGDNETVVVTRNYTDGVPGIEGLYRYVDYGLALWTALKAGRTVVRSDIANDRTLNEAEKAAHAALQLGASVNVPLVKAGRLAAILFVHFQAAHDWSTTELALIHETAERTWADVERARAEAALHKSEALFRQIFELTGVGMAQVDPYTLRFLLVNRKLSEMTGYPPQELLALTTTALTHPDDREQNQAIWAKTFSGETAQFAIEKRYVRKDGQVIWVSVVATIQRDEAGKPLRAISSIKEITERKEAEAQLQRAARFDAFRLALADALRLLTDPLAIQRAALRVVGEHLQVDRVFYGEVTADGAAVVVADNYVRAGVAKLVGRFPLRDDRQTSKLRAGQTRIVEDVSTTTELAADEKAAYQAVGIVASVGVPLVKHDRWVSNLGVHQQSARVWQPDEIAMLAETAERTWDAVERARAETALHQAEELRRALTTNLPGSAVFVVNQELRYLLAEGEALAQAGQQATDFTGKTLFDVLSPEVLAKAKPLYLTALSGTPFTHEHEAGEQYYLSRGVPLYMGNGDIYAALVVSYNITDRKRVEAALQHLNLTLEQQVETRTTQVRALASSLTMAEQEERRRISQILHDDLQQLLYGMQMRLLTMINDINAGNTTELAHYAQQVYDWMDDAIQTTRRLTVDLSPPVLKHEGLADMLRWLVRQMADMNGLQVDLHAEDAVQMADEGMRLLLFQIVRELLFNVVKHGKTDRARLELVNRGEGECLIIVSDEGQGFDVTAGQTEQSGFGLFSARERLKLFGGRLAIQSAPGQGTRVTIYVPVSTALSSKS
ncbi:MAG: PAS domain S-box protein [Caldilinea sp. CFX5]|nr:PAS domain S-box protein [Caldilinea sp. CFX5]